MKTTFERYSEAKTLTFDTPIVKKTENLRDLLAQCHPYFTKLECCHGNIHYPKHFWMATAKIPNWKYTTIYIEKIGDTPEEALKQLAQAIQKALTFQFEGEYYAKKAIGFTNDQTHIRMVAEGLETCTEPRCPYHGRPSRK